MSTLARLSGSILLVGTVGSQVSQQVLIGIAAMSGLLLLVPARPIGTEGPPMAVIRTGAQWALVAGLLYASLSGAFEAGIHGYQDLPHVVDTRNLGLIGAVELAPRAGAPGARAQEVHAKAWERGVFVRAIGEAIAFCPPLMIDKDQLDQVFGVVGEVLREVA